MPSRSTPSRVPPSCLSRPWLLAVAVWWLAAGPVTAQEIGKLYATRPPPGSVFVRVAAIGRADAKLQLNGRELPIPDGHVASRYRVARADSPFKLSIDGAPVGENVKFAPDRFYTLVVARDGAKWSIGTIDEGQGANASDLKAQLRFFNLVPGCEATLRIAEGPTVFDAVGFAAVKSRAINPVEAQLEAACGGSQASLKLPPLRSGDHYSLFLTQTGSASALSGQFDETEPYQER